jgi:hypothetical protein
MRRPPGFYFSAVETLVNVVFRFVPSVATATMIATEIPAAISPYSIAVAPELSLTKRKSIRYIARSSRWWFVVAATRGN